MYAARLPVSHHWMRRMNVRGDTPSIAAACASVIRPVTRTGNARNSALARALPPSPALLARQRMHRDRCLPDDVVPFLRIGSPHIVHSLASDDFLLPIRQAQQEHVFRKNQAGTPIMPRTQNHPATRLTAVGISGKIKHTFCHLTLGSCGGFVVVSVRGHTRGDRCREMSQPGRWVCHRAYVWAYVS